MSEAKIPLFSVNLTNLQKQVANWLCYWNYWTSAHMFNSLVWSEKNQWNLTKPNLSIKSKQISVFIPFHSFSLHTFLMTFLFLLKVRTSVFLRDFGRFSLYLSTFFVPVWPQVSRTVSVSNSVWKKVKQKTKRKAIHQHLRYFLTNCESCI